MVENTILIFFTIDCIFEPMPPVHLDILHAEASAELLRVMHSEFPVAMLQLPAVFALIAPSNAAGVEALNTAKRRLSGKHYGSAIGGLREFLAMADPDYLPEIFQKDEASLCALEGSFIRLSVGEAAIETPTITGGTHQGLLLAEGPERALFKAIERSFQHSEPNEVFAGARYYAPICTSANLSGDPLGSITDMHRAIEFMGDCNIPLLLSNDAGSALETGSYPIFAFERNTVRVMRQGPAQERILRALPSTITVR
jgi:tRNA A37 threonylcarbamoyladenosine synthetase subunit TsaC/SUA5/YrdC